MKTKLFIVLIVSLLSFSIEAKPKKKATLPAFNYINKGSEAYYVSLDTIKVVALDLNAEVRIYADKELPISYLEQAAIRVVDGLAEH